MKKNIFGAAIFALLISCKSPLESAYVLKLPAVNESWVSILGEPVWHIEYLGRDGRIHELDTTASVAVELYDGGSSFALAEPYWPERGFARGEFRPAGAVFPLDAEGPELALSWLGGVEAYFWRALAWEGRRASGNHSPANFNWKKVRALFEDGALSDEILSNPWLVDWDDLAHKTSVAGFDKNRITSEYRVQKTSYGASFYGTWYGASPFADPVEIPWPADTESSGEPPPPASIRLPILPTVEFLFSETGVIRYWHGEPVFRSW
jgi:hypothetical protein